MNDTKHELLNLLSLNYINSRYILEQAKIKPVKWQNIKRGYVHDFSPKETGRLVEVIDSIKEKVGMFLKWYSLSILRELLNSKFLILKPLIHEASQVEYDRILRFKRGESDMDKHELEILIKAFKNQIIIKE